MVTWKIEEMRDDKMIDNNNIDVSCCVELNVYITQQLISSLRYTFMTTCFGSLLIHLQVTYHFIDYVVAMLLLLGYP
jgi:hypothetical protein